MLLFSIMFYLGVGAQNPTPSITLVSNTACVNTPILASGSVSGGVVTSWSWGSNPVANATFTSPTLQNTNITFAAAGTYTLTLSVQPGGAQVTAIVTVNSQPNVSISASTDTICVGGAGATLTASGATTYAWLPVTGLNPATGAVVTATPTANTTYSVIGISNGCADTATQTIAIATDKPVNASSTSDTACVGGHVTLSAVTPGAASYSWAPATGLSCTNCPAPVYSPVTAGTLTFTVTVNGTCINPKTDTLRITTKNCAPHAGFIMPNPTWICRFDCIQFLDTSKSAPLQYMWVFDGGIPDTSYEQNPTVCYNIESTLAPFGAYGVKLVITNAIGMKDSVTKLISVLPTPIASINNGTSSVTIQTGDEVVLNAADWTGGATNFSWAPASDLSCTNCGAPVASPLFTSTYVVTATAANGCKDTDTITVYVELRCGEVFVPNVFSPNKDGKNDILHVRNNCLSTIDFRVFDRWGELVFYSKTPGEGWDGTYRGKELDPAVFVYSLEAVLSNGVSVSKKGNITLIR